MENVFTGIYENKLWGSNENSHYTGSSGPGSSVEINEHTYIPFLKKYIKENNIKSVVDMGCGDFRCGRLIYDDLDVSYTGYDTYKKVVDYNRSQHPSPKYSFTHLDFCNNKDAISGGDMCILKDVIQHWQLSDIYKFLDYLVETKKFKHILICNCCQQPHDDTDIETGSWRGLSCDFLPLKKYNPKKLYNYSSKEVSVIKIE